MCLYPDRGAKRINYLNFNTDINIDFIYFDKSYMQFISTLRSNSNGYPRVSNKDR